MSQTASLSSSACGLSRRGLIRLGASAALITVLPGRAFAEAEDVIAAQKALFGEREIKTGRVALKLPPIAENGYSVPLNISVDSPMTETDYVERIAVFSERNPLADVAHYTLGPRAGRAKIGTRIRLGGTQTITAVAEMNDGTLWAGTADTVVTLAACVVL